MHRSRRGKGMISRQASDPCIDKSQSILCRILEFPTSTIEDDVLLYHTDLMNFITSNKMDVPEDLIRKVSLMEKSYMPTTVLKSINFPNRTDSILISLAYDYITSNDNCPKICAYVIFKQAFVWSIAKGSGEDVATNLISALGVLLDFGYHEEVSYTFQILLQSMLQRENFSISDISFNIIFNHIKENHSLPESFDSVFASLLRRITQDPHEPLLSVIIQSCVLFFNENRQFFGKNTVGAIAELIKPQLEHLHPLSTHLLCRLCTMKGEISMHVLVMMQSMAQAVLNADAIDFQDINIENIDNFDISEFIYSFVDKTIPSNLPSPPSVEGKSNLRMLYKDNGHIVWQELEKNRSELNLPYVESFLVSIGQKIISEKSSKIVSFLAIFIHFFTVFGGKIAVLPFEFAIFSPSVLIPSLTVFHGPIPEPLGNLRNGIFDFVALRHLNFASKALQSAAEVSPYLLAEYCLRIQERMHKFSALSLCTDSALSGVANMISALLRDIDSGNETRLKTETKLIALKVILKFLIKLFRTSICFVAISAMHEFPNKLLHLLADSRIRGPILTELSAALIDSGKKSVSTMMMWFPALAALFNEMSPNYIITPNFKTQILPPFNKCAESQKLCLTVIKIISQILIENHHVFTQIARCLPVMIEHSDASGELLEIILQILSLSPKNYKLRASLFKTVIGLIRKVEKHNLTEKTAKKLIDLISTDTEKNENQKEFPFLIQRSSFIPLILVVTPRDDIGKIIDMFDKLCDYSNSNCAACHDGDLDFLLLKGLGKDSHFIFNGVDVYLDCPERFDIFVPLALKIMTVKSSTVVVDRLIGTMNPIKDTFMPNLYESIADQLSARIAAEKEIRYPTFSLYRGDIVASIRGLRSETLSAAFSISFWMILDVPELNRTGDEFDIFKIYSETDEERCLRLFANNGVLGIKHGRNMKEFTYQFQHVQWTLITLIFDGNGKVSLFENDEEKCIIDFTKLNFVDENLRLEFGSSISSPTKEGQCVGRIGPFSVINEAMRVSDLKNIITRDPNFRRYHSVLNSFKLMHPTTETGYKMDKRETRVNGDTLIEVISSDYDLNYLASMLSSFKPEHHKASLLFLRIVFTSLGTSPQKQQEFYATPIIANLIPKVFQGFIDFQLYNLFASFIMQGSFEPLIEEVVDGIILNLSIWSCSGSDSLQKIIVSWTRAIIDQQGPKMFRRWSFSRFLALFRVFYFDEPDNNVYGDDTNKCTQVDFENDTFQRSQLYSVHITGKELEKCRHRYIDFLVTIAERSLTETDVYALYSHLFDAPSADQRCSLLELTERIAKIIIEKCPEKFDPTVLLQRFFNTRDNRVIVAAAKAIDVLSGKHVHVAMCAASVQIATIADGNSLLPELVKEVEAHPNLYPLCCSVAVKCDEASIHSFCSEIAKVTTNTDFVKRFRVRWPWSLFPIGLLFSCPISCVDAFITVISRIIIEQDQTQLIPLFLQIISLIDTLSMANAKRSMYVKSRFMLIFFEELREANVMIKKSIAGIIAEHIFFDSTPCQTSPLEDALADCVFGALREKKKEVMLNSVIASNDAQSESVVRRFCMHVWEGGWLDKSLAMHISHFLSPESDFNVLIKYGMRQKADGSKLSFFSAVERIQDVISERPIVRLTGQLRQLFEKTQATVSSGLEFIDNKIEEIAPTAVHNELDRFGRLCAQAYERGREVKKEFTSQRDTRLFKEGRMVYKREDSACIGMCPFKIKPDLFGRVAAGRKDTASSAGHFRDALSQTERCRGSEGEWKKGVQGCKVYPCVLLKLSTQRRASAIIAPPQITITYEEGRKQRVISTYEIRRVYERSVYQRPTGIEILLTTGKTFLIDFSPIESKEIIGKMRREMLPTIEYVKQKENGGSKMTEKWIARKVSNFRYLMELNMISGRTFNSESMYPIMPWLTLDGEMSLSRDLSKPAKYTRNRIERDDDPSMNASPLSPLVLDYFLVRLQPFTDLHIRMQGGRFDQESRIFTDYVGAAENAASEMGDLRELPAEFFFEPEAFININGVDLGTADGDVTLPATIRDAYEFVYQHRKLLESEPVSRALSKWIDFIFGIRQSGPKAFEIGNYVHDFLYKEVWRAVDAESAAGEQTKTAMRLYGAMPCQLFDEPHPARGPAPVAGGESRTYKISESVLFGRVEGRSITYIESSGDVFKFDLAKIQKVNVVSLGEGSMFCELEKGICALDGSGCSLQFIVEDRVEVHRCSFAEAIFGCGSYICTVRNRTTATVYSVGAFPFEHGSVVVVEDVIEKAVGSGEFNTIVLATRDGALHVVSSGSMKRRAVCELGGQAECVAITPSWGFIVAVLEGEVIVFNTNGHEIRRTAFGFDVAQWRGFSTVKDFDYIAFVDVCGRVGVFEAFNPERVFIVGCVTSAPVMVDFMEESQSVVVLTVDGILSLFPCGDIL